MQFFWVCKQKKRLNCESFVAIDEIDALKRYLYNNNLISTQSPFQKTFNFWWNFEIRLKNNFPRDLIDMWGPFSGYKMVKFIENKPFLWLNDRFELFFGNKPRYLDRLFYRGFNFNYERPPIFKYSSI